MVTTRIIAENTLCKTAMKFVRSSKIGERSMEMCGILDSDKKRAIEQLVEKRVNEMQEANYCIITNADRDKIRKDIKAELFLRTGIVAT
jgi:hypothetical protein